MILKCEACSYVWECHDPATGFEDDLDVGNCPNCVAQLNSPVKQVKLIQYLLVAQFLSAAAAVSVVVFSEIAQGYLWSAILIISTFGLLFLNNRKGSPFVLKRVARKNRSRTETTGESSGA